MTTDHPLISSFHKTKLVQDGDATITVDDLVSWRSCLTDRMRILLLSHWDDPDASAGETEAWLAGGVLSDGLLVLFGEKQEQGGTCMTGGGGEKREEGERERRTEREKRS